MGIHSVDFNNVNLDDTNDDGDEPRTVIDVRLLAWHSKFEKCKWLKKDCSKELMLVTWHPLGLWDWCLPKDEKNEKEPIFTE